MEPSTRRRRTVRRCATAALAVALTSTLLGWSVALPAAADTVEFTIADPDITESSGLATDADAERYWTVNDSGDAGIAYALDDQGETQGTLEFRVEPVDVEAVAFHEGRLYVADIGDNRSRRDTVTVYFFDDAAPATEPVVYKAYDFSYPDGPHDAETLLVDGDGRLFIVTKGAEGGIYAAPSSPSRQGVNELERVGDAPAVRDRRHRALRRSVRPADLRLGRDRRPATRTRSWPGPRPRPRSRASRSPPPSTASPC